jgi:hypothetical protein
VTAGLKFRQLQVPSFGEAQPSSQVAESLLQTVEPLYKCEQSDFRPGNVTIAATPIPFGIGAVSLYRNVQYYGINPRTRLSFNIRGSIDVD